MAIKQITAPALPVTLAEAKLQCQVDFTDDDALITSMIKAATAAVEQELEACLLEQTWDYYRDKFPDCGEPMRLPLSPVRSVSSVNYISATTGLEVVMAGSGYEVDLISDKAWIAPGDAGWPSPADVINAVRVRFVAGYGNPHDSPVPVDVLPEPIRQAILITVRDLYDQRGEVVTGTIVAKIPDTLERLLAPYRRFTL